MSINYELSKRIGGKANMNYLEDLSKELYPGVKKLPKSILKGLTKLIKFYAVSNSSKFFQERYEDKHKWYNGSLATMVSAGLNVLTYLTIGELAEKFIQGCPQDFHRVMVGWSFCEGALRGIFGLVNVMDNEPYGSIASFPGKIISYPLEAIVGFYEGRKEKKNSKEIRRV